MFKTVQNGGEFVKELHNMIQYDLENIKEFTQICEWGINASAQQTSMRQLTL